MTLEGAREGLGGETMGGAGGAHGVMISSMWERSDSRAHAAVGWRRLASEASGKRHVATCRSTKTSTCATSGEREEGLGLGSGLGKTSTCSTSGEREEGGEGSEGGEGIRGC